MKSTKTVRNRVADHTPRKINQDIREHTNTRLAQYARFPERVPEALVTLEAEWDVERLIQAWDSSLILAGLALAVLADPLWLWLSGLAAFSLFLHALIGWSLCAWILRRMGRRTKEEILRERYALKILRGDFQQVCSSEHDDLIKRLDAVIESVNE
ncbi:MAG: hypothetical protein ACLFPX_06070 [Candidatus Omnitrophota bacterium]